MSRPAKRTVPLEQLLPALEQSITARPCLIGLLVREFGYTERAIRVRLDRLEHEQRIHRVRIVSEATRARCTEWRAGADPAAAPILSVELGQQPPADRQRVTVPFQPTVRSWPTIGMRDPLVAALFGPAHPEAACA